MIKKLFFGFLILIAVVVVALIIFLLTFDLNHYREFTEKKLSMGLGYPVKIGSMRTKLSFVPTIQINNFKVYQNGEDPHVILDVPHIDATVEIMPLIKNFQIEIQKINALLISADLTLLTDNKQTKTTNKSAAKSKSAQPSDSVLKNLWIKELTVNKVLCRFMNKDKKDAFELTDLSLQNLIMACYVDIHTKHVYNYS